MKLKFNIFGKMGDNQFTQIIFWIFGFKKNQHENQSKNR